MEALSGLSAEQAAARPVPRAHSMYELAHHIAAWMGEAHSRLTGSPAKDPAEGDFPPKDTMVDEARWRSVLDRLAKVQADLLAAASAFEPSRLDDRLEPSLPGASGRVTAYVLLQGIAQHNAYHAGQIMLLRRALGV
jgi:uncharacterized damage-inducible protein DinB